MYEKKDVIHVSGKNKVMELFETVSDELFYLKGYSSVSVADICKKAGKAKGLFFYYYEKKENMVKLLLNRQIDEISQKFVYFLDNFQGSSIDKINFLMNALLSSSSEPPRAVMYFKDEGIPGWVDSYSNELMDKYIFPIILCIVEKDYSHVPKEAVEIAYYGISAFMHNNHYKMGDKAFYEKAIASIADTLERTLGCDKGMITIN